MDKLTIKADGSNDKEDIDKYSSILNNLSNDSEFNVLGAQSEDRETAYKLGVDEGRK